MTVPRTGLQNDCHVTAVAIVCYGHHDQCGLDVHPLHTAVVLCLHALPPLSSSNAAAAKDSLLGEHPPCKPRQEGRSSGCHLGRVEHVDAYLKDYLK